MHRDTSALLCIYMHRPQWIRWQRRSGSKAERNSMLLSQILTQLLSELRAQGLTWVRVDLDVGLVARCSSARLSPTGRNRDHRSPPGLVETGCLWVWTWSGSCGQGGSGLAVEASPSDRICFFAGTPSGFRGPGIHGSRDSGIQGFRHPGIQGCRDSGIQRGVILGAIRGVI